MGKALSIIILVACSLAEGTLSAQPFAHDMRSYFDFGEQFYAAAEESADARSLDVRINTANSLFSFLKTDKANALRGSYFAVRDISIEIREKPAGQTLKALNIRDTIFSNSFSETNSKEAWNSIVRNLQLDGIALPKNVELYIEVRDGFRARLANRPTTIPLPLRAFRADRPMTGGDTTFIGMSDLFILESQLPDGTFRSRNWGNTTEFSRDLRIGVNLALDKNIRFDSIVFRLVQLSNIFQEKDFPVPTELVSMAIHHEDLMPQQKFVVSASDSEITYSTNSIASGDSAFTAYTANVLIPGTGLEQGKYRIDVKVRAGGSWRSLGQPLELQWHYMPLSLENPRDAVPPLQHIASDEEFKDISNASRSEQMKKVYAFWKKQDPTTSTAFNERMDEFYRRADYAYFNFARNSRLLDGALTDRGKIYILFGPPTNIERSFLLGEQPVEIWSYSNNVKKLIKFIDPNGHGEYKLVEVKNM
ncbi:MAG: GWxTD domain-containing protein [Ignavibacteriota bacterium]